MRTECPAPMAAARKIAGGAWVARATWVASVAWVAFAISFPCAASGLASSGASAGVGPVPWLTLHAPAPPQAQGPPQPTLELGALPTPPPLPSGNAVTLLARRIHGEIAALATRADAAEPVPAARIAFRRVVYDLLFHGADAEAQAMAVAGLRLADCRETLDRLLESLPFAVPTAPGAPTPLPPTPADDHRADLARFAAACAQGLHPLPSAAQPERALAERLEPLRRVVAWLEQRADPAQPNAWPTLEGAARGAQSQWAAEDAAADLRAALAAAVWLTPSERTACAALAAAPPAGDARLASALAECLARASDLTRGEGAWDAVRLRAMVVAITAQPNADAVETLARTLRAAQAVRTFDASTLPPTVRGAAREIQVQARRAAVKLAPLLSRLATAEHALASPELASAMEAQTGAAADLSRLRAAGGWPERLAAVRAGSREPFEGVVRAWSGALVQPDQRARTRSTMDAFAGQLARFAPVRMETRLRAEDPRAVAATAGQARALLAELDTRRTAWALAWTRGGGGAAAAAMNTAARVMEALAAVAALRGDRPAREDATDGRAHEGAAAQAALSRWGGCAAPPGGMGVHPRTLEARAEVAVEALLAGDNARAETHLSAIERDAPVAWFVALALEHLQGWIAQRGGVSAQLDAACSGPGPDSWLGAARQELMLLSRYMREETALRGAADRERAEALRVYLGGLAQALARHAGVEPPLTR